MPPPPPDCVLATIDGAARGNPGPAAYGVVFEDRRGKLLRQLARRVGKTTNNVAEYRALLAALAHARQQGWQALRVRTDSELLARQLEGDYRVRSADLKPLYEEARRFIAALHYFAVEAVPRKLTRTADKLANAALDGRPAYALRALASKPPTRRRESNRRTPSSLAPSSRAKGREATGKLTVRAVYQEGVLKPQEPLDLPDGAEVELTLQRPPRK